MPGGDVGGFIGVLWCSGEYGNRVRSPDRVCWRGRCARDAEIGCAGVLRSVVGEVPIGRFDLGGFIKGFVSQGSMATGCVDRAVSRAGSFARGMQSRLRGGSKVGIGRGCSMVGLDRCGGVAGVVRGPILRAGCWRDRSAIDVLSRRKQLRRSLGGFIGFWLALGGQRVGGVELETRRAGRSCDCSEAGTIRAG